MDPFDGAMVLFDAIIEILDLADGKRSTMLLVIALDGRCIGRAPVDGDLLGHAVTADRFGQEALRGLPMTSRPTLRPDRVLTSLVSAPTGGASGVTASHLCVVMTLLRYVLHTQR